MKAQRMLFRATSLSALALMFGTSPQLVHGQSVGSDDISKLIVDAKSHAVLAEDDAATLDSYTRGQMSSRGHGNKLDEIKDHVNELAKVTNQLRDLRPFGSPWQQKAIDQIDPLLREMARVLTQTIDHLNGNQSRVHMQAYRDYVHANYEITAKTARMIRDLVDYDKAKSTADSLEAKLGVVTADRE